MIALKTTLALAVAVFVLGGLSAQNQQWLWACDGGGTSSDEASYGIIRDTDGFVYVTGTFRSPGYFGDDTLNGQPYSGNEVLVGRLTSAGQWTWAVRGGGLGSDTGHSLAIDPDGYIHAVGKYNGTVYPHADFGIHTLSGNGSYLAKLNQSGAWMTACDLPGYANDLAIDDQGNCYVIGYFSGTVSFGSTTLTSTADNDIYVAKFSSAGACLWAVRAGGASSSGLDDRGNGIALDSDINVYITGSFCGTADFGDTNLSAQNHDIFIAKLDSDGNWLWARKAGGSSSDSGYDIKADSFGNCYVTGGFKTGWFGSTYLTTSNTDVFVTKLNSTGDFLWAKKGGSSYLDEGLGIALDALNNSYITGYFTREATFGTTVLANSNSSNDVFVAKLDTAGNWVWAIRAGGVNSEIAEDIEVSPDGICYITGAYYGNTSFGSHSLSSWGGVNTDIFIACLGVAPPMSPDYVLISRSGNDVILQWDEVTQNIYGDTITPVGYNVYYSDNPDPNVPATLLQEVVGTSFTHTNGTLTGKRFYHIKAKLSE